jgi:hypothetical protein
MKVERSRKNRGRVAILNPQLTSCLDSARECAAIVQRQRIAKTGLKEKSRSRVIILAGVDRHTLNHGIGWLSFLSPDPA